MNVIGKIPGVRKTTTSIVPLVLKDVYQWRIPKAACGSVNSNLTMNIEENIDGNKLAEK